MTAYATCSDRRVGGPRASALTADTLEGDSVFHRGGIINGILHVELGEFTTLSAALRQDPRADHHLVIETVQLWRYGVNLGARLRYYSAFSGNLIPDRSIADLTS